LSLHTLNVTNANLGAWDTERMTAFADGITRNGSLATLLTESSELNALQDDCFKILMDRLSAHHQVIIEFREDDDITGIVSPQRRAAIQGLITRRAVNKIKDARQVSAALEELRRLFREAGGADFVKIIFDYFDELPPHKVKNWQEVCGMFGYVNEDNGAVLQEMATNLGSLDAVRDNYHPSQINPEKFLLYNLLLEERHTLSKSPQKGAGAGAGAETGAPVHFAFDHKQKEIETKVNISTEEIKRLVDVKFDKDIEESEALLEKTGADSIEKVKGPKSNMWKLVFSNKEDAQKFIRIRNSEPPKLS